MKRVLIPLSAVLFCALLAVGLFFLSTTSVQGTVSQVWEDGVVVDQGSVPDALFLPTDHAGTFQVGDRVEARVSGALFEVSPSYYEHTYWVRATG